MKKRVFRVLIPDPKGGTANLVVEVGPNEGVSAAEQAAQKHLGTSALAGHVAHLADIDVAAE